MRLQNPLFGEVLVILNPARFFPPGQPHASGLVSILETLQTLSLGFPSSFAQGERAAPLPARGCSTDTGTVLRLSSRRGMRHLQAALLAPAADTGQNGAPGLVSSRESKAPARMEMAFGSGPHPTSSPLDHLGLAGLGRAGAGWARGVLGPVGHRDPRGPSVAPAVPGPMRWN